MSSDPIRVTLLVTRALDRLRVPYLLGGSLASAVHGLVRATMDSDLVADLKLDDARPLAALLGNEFYIDAEMIAEAIKHGSSFNAIHLKTMHKVDVFIAKRPFDHNELERSERYTVIDDSDETMCIATAEDIILAKLEWYQNGHQVSERQWSDVLGIMGVKAGKLDFTHLLIEHPTENDPGRAANQTHRDRDMDLLGEVDFIEITVNDSTAEGLALDLLGDHGLAGGLGVALEIDQRVDAAMAHREQMLELRSIEGDRRRGASAAVHDARSQPALTKLAGRTFAGGLPSLDDQFYITHDSSSLVPAIGGRAVDRRRAGDPGCDGILVAVSDRLCSSSCPRPLLGAREHSQNSELTLSSLLMRRIASPIGPATETT